MAALYGNLTENFKASFHWLTLFIKGTNCLYVNEHLKKSVKSKFRESDFDLVVILGRLTNIYQPLNVAIKPFKDNLRKEWHLWMANGGAGETAAGNL
ncbi:hypothetical protein RhiirA5_440935 [Rhizophagus irregularis]|uniref:Uncharacterized protein n=1 Tax=Rhizophagus irregularis TaxID=588596 RepID=A0A2I1EA15_9GLOM|nr:hypothetical protein RhiirA5_440935 [Rhizophagus irregularis]PKC54101.1 hypothetical protein RhiirA1_477968 [Rhizophagus irregularis]PKY18959.1 hypothetical protein RhiirB3_431873 [Rhizophagus irregularis]